MNDRQTIHLKAPGNWINDPNGFICCNGVYHLFYQYFPYEPRWGTMHWGHAVSRDMVTWEHRGIALRPSIRADRNGCFSGSAVEDGGKLVLFYTGVRYESVNPDDPHTCLDDRFESTQLMIASEDGFEFDNQNGKEVIIPPITDHEIGDRTHTRDPKVWKGKEGWYLILGSTVEKKYGEVLFYRSSDLHRWTYAGKVWKGPEYGWMWECPDYFRTKGGDVFIVSAMGLLKGDIKEKNQTICFPVSFEENTCAMKIPDTWQFVDYGMDLYAPQTAEDEEGRRTMIAWARMPEVTDEGWIGMFCSPRLVERKGDHIYFRLHPNIRKALTKEIAEPGEAGENAYLASFMLRDGESVDIGGFLVSRKDGHIRTDRTDVYPGFEGAHLVSESPEIREGCRVEALVDRNLIEVYINDGEYVISNVVYNLRQSVRSSSGETVVLRTI